MTSHGAGDIDVNLFVGSKLGYSASTNSVGRAQGVDMASTCFGEVGEQKPLLLENFCKLSFSNRECQFRLRGLFHPRGQRLVLPGQSIPPAALDPLLLYRHTPRSRPPRRTRSHSRLLA